VRVVAVALAAVAVGHPHEPRTLPAEEGGEPLRLGKRRSEAGGRGGGACSVGGRLCSGGGAAGGGRRPHRLVALIDGVAVVVPAAHRRVGLGRIAHDRHRQRTRARRAELERLVVRLGQLRLDEAELGCAPLREEGAILVHHHPQPIELEPALVERGRIDRHAARRLERVDVDGGHLAGAHRLWPVPAEAEEIEQASGGENEERPEAGRLVEARVATEAEGREHRRESHPK
jgi:hypothetical protein